MRYSRIVYLVAIGVCAMTNKANAAAVLQPTSGPVQTLRPRALDISTRIDGAWAHSTVTTIYARQSKQLIEADLTLSVPDGAVVTGFSYWHGNERVTARVTEKERADLIQTATPREKEREIESQWAPLAGKNLFRAHLHAVMPGRDLRVELQMVQPLQNEGAALVWQYPLASEARDVTLDWLRLRASAPDETKVFNNYGARVSGDELSVKKYNFNAKTDVRIAFGRSKSGLNAQISTEHVGGRAGEAYFALALQSSEESPTLPVISGVETFEVLPPQRVSPGEVRIFGRYRGQGVATASWGKKQTVVWFSPPSNAANEVSGLAAPLWGAERLENLSGQKNARAASIALSKRFNLSSPFVTFVAIPAKQRKIIDAQLRQADLARRGAKWSRNWVLEIENGRPLSPQSLQARQNLRQIARSSIGRKYGFDEEKARKKATQKRLGELARLVMARRMNIASKNPDAAKKMAQLARFSEQSTAKYLQKAGQNLRELQVETLEKRWTAEVVALRGQTAGAGRLKRQLQILQSRYGLESDFETEAYRRAARQMAYSALNEALAGRENSPRATLLIDAGERFGRRVGQDSFGRAFYQPALAQTMQNAREVYLAEIEAGRDQSEEARSADTRLRQIYALAPQMRGSLREKGSLQWEIETARRGLARETAYRIAKSRAERPSDRNTLRELETQLERIAAQTEREPEEYLRLEARRYQKGEPLLSARQFRLAKSGIDPDTDESWKAPRGAPNLEARDSDPRLSLVLPAQTRFVEATFPGGKAQNLRFHAEKGAWESQFYLSKLARSGRVLISLRSVDAAGREKRWKLDLSLPDDDNWQIGVWTPVKTQRVSVVLFDQARASLPALPTGQFAASVAVSPTQRLQKPVLRFLIDDGTAQTTEIALRW